MWVRFYKFVKLIGDTRHRFFVDLVVASTTAYIAIDQFTEDPLANFLTDVFTRKLAEDVKWLLIVIVCYGAISKVVLMVLERVPLSKILATESDSLAQCCLRINNEIGRHIKVIRNDPGRARGTFIENHSFDLNLALVVECFHNHIVEKLRSSKKKDVFVSVYLNHDFYEYEQDITYLDYETHYPSKKDFIKTKQIEIGAKEYWKYECVKCINSEDSTKLVIDTTDFYRSSQKRLKNIKHYIGMKLYCDQRVIGFVNVEFYNTNFFALEDDMSAFVEEQMLPFRYLIEYQLLKRIFFRLLEQNFISKTSEPK